MHTHSVHYRLSRLTLVFLSMLLILGIAVPNNNGNANRRRHVHYSRRGRVHHCRFRRSNHHYRRRHYRRRVRYFRRYRIHYTKPYPTVNDHVRWVDERINWNGREHHHKETIKSVYGPKVTFKTLCFVPTGLAGDNFLVQSLNVFPDGRYAFVGYGHNPFLKHGHGLTRIAKVDLRHHRYQISKVFNGGHGQAVAYNPVKHSLWILKDLGGPISRGSLEQISINSLKPKHQIHFRLKSDDALGDSLAFDNHNHVYNENLIWRDTADRGFRGGMIILYRGLLNRKHVRFNIVSQGLRHSPSNVIQGIAYNPRKKRLYIEANDAIMSLPVNRLGHLRPRDFKETILRQHREYEGIAFDRSGHAYILLSHPKEIMKSTGVF